jgi:hypothetical protein
MMAWRNLPCSSRRWARLEEVNPAELDLDYTANFAETPRKVGACFYKDLNRERIVTERREVSKLHLCVLTQISLVVVNWTRIFA